jgi:FkbM family methyltransferase
VNVNLAVSNKPGQVKFYFQKKISQLITTKKDISLNRMQGNIKEKYINSDTLTSIIEKTKFKNKKIDFLNIDVEGADYETLTSLDFKIYCPKIICIEITENNIEDSKIFKFLTNLNYKKVWSSKANISHIFIN